MSEADGLAASPRQLNSTEKIAVWFLPNVGDIIFALVLALLLWARPSFVFGDGSTGWHLVTGDYILSAHGVPYKDLLSYTKPEAAWVAYEWLFDVLAAGLVKLGHGDLNLLAVCVSFAIAGLILLVYERCRKEGGNPFLSLFIVLLGAFVSSVHWLARPGIFTFFGVFFFSTWLEDFWRGQLKAKQLIWRLALCMVVWVNTHPAFLFGFALLFIYLVSSLLCACFSYGSSRFSRYVAGSKVLLLALLACLLAFMCNPYGIKLYQYIANYLHGSAAVVLATDEFLSPVFHWGLAPTCLEILFALFITALAVTRKKLSLPRLLTCIAFSHLALSAVRNMPLFMIVVLPAISQMFSQVELGEPSEKAWWKPVLNKLEQFSDGFNENEALCSHHLLLLIAFVLLALAAVNHGQFLGSQWLTCGWGVQDKPSATVEYLGQAESKAVLDPKRGFNFDNWGGYLRYKLGQRVFIDDRADFYGEKFYYKYSIVSLAQPGWRQQLDGQILEETPAQGSSIQWVLMPKNSRLAAVLKDDPEWGPAVKEDEASALFVRK